MISLSINNYLIPFKHFKFPGGEVQVQLSSLSTMPQNAGAIAISWIWQNDNDELTILEQLVDALRYHYATCQTAYTLYMPYLPYARQDRVCNAGEAFALKIFAKHINALKFSYVTIDDPHSDVGPALIDNAVIRHPLINEAKLRLNPATHVLISPDAGALKKVYKISAHWQGIPVVESSKIRDVKTGHILKSDVSHNIRQYVDKPNITFLVVDDIFDGGATFAGLAKELIAQGVKKEQLELYVTHGMFTKPDAFPEIEALYNKIYTTKSVVRSRQPANVVEL